MNVFLRMLGYFVLLNILLFGGIFLFFVLSHSLPLIMTAIGVGAVFRVCWMAAKRDASVSGKP